jgi:hypothetical protein
MRGPSMASGSAGEAEAIILEGVAEYFSGNESPFRPFWALRPTRAFAWTLEGFPRGATRWRFEKAIPTRV